MGSVRFLKQIVGQPDLAFPDVDPRGSPSRLQSVVQSQWTLHIRDRAKDRFLPLEEVVTPRPLNIWISTYNITRAKTKALCELRVDFQGLDALFGR